MTDNKSQKGKYHTRIFLKDFFGFAEHQGKGTCGSEHKLTITRNSDNAVLMKIMQSTLGKVKLMTLNGMLRIIVHQFPFKLYYLNIFSK